eukprot:1185693-Prorocentrum_minimum.AAC.1
MPSFSHRRIQDSPPNERLLDGVGQPGRGLLQGQIPTTNYPPLSPASGAARLRVSASPCTTYRYNAFYLGSPFPHLVLGFTVY